MSSSSSWSFVSSRNSVHGIADAIKVRSKKNQRVDNEIQATLWEINKLWDKKNSSLHPSEWFNINKTKLMTGREKKRKREKIFKNY